MGGEMLGLELGRIAEEASQPVGKTKVSVPHKTVGSNEWRNEHNPVHPYK
jgi:hypothetical protein